VHSPEVGGEGGPRDARYNAPLPPGLLSSARPTRGRRKGQDVQSRRIVVSAAGLTRSKGSITHFAQERRVDWSGRSRRNGRMPRQRCTPCQAKCGPLRKKKGRQPGLRARAFGAKPRTSNTVTSYAWTRQTPESGAGRASVTKSDTGNHRVEIGHLTPQAARNCWANSVLMPMQKRSSHPVTARFEVRRAKLR